MFDLSILGVTPGFDGVSFRYPDFERVTSQSERRSYEDIDSDLFALDASMTSVVQLVRVNGNQHVHTWIGLYRPLKESRNSDRIGGYVGVGIWLVDRVCEASALVRLFEAVHDMTAERLIRGGVFVSGLGALTPGDFIDLAPLANDVAIGLIPLLRERPVPGVNGNRCIIMPDADETTWASAIDRIQRSRMFVDPARWLVGAGPRVTQSARAHGRLTVVFLARFVELDDALRKRPVVEPSPPRTETEIRGRTAETPPPRRPSTSIVPVAPPRAVIPTEPTHRTMEIVDTMPESDPNIIRSVAVVARDVKTVLTVTERMEKDILDICREVERIKCSNGKLDLRKFYKTAGPALILFITVFLAAIVIGKLILDDPAQKRAASSTGSGTSPGGTAGTNGGTGGATTKGAGPDGMAAGEVSPPKPDQPQLREEAKESTSLSVDRRKYEESIRLCEAVMNAASSTTPGSRTHVDQGNRSATGTSGNVNSRQNDILAICNNLLGMRIQ